MIENETPTPQVSETFSSATQQVAELRRQIKLAVVGQESTIDLVLVALLAGGHVLLEGVPGLGKTLLVRALAKAFSGSHGRVQFTPDLMPSDVIGHILYDLPTSQFKVRRGPVFTNILLADEINRAPAKTQAALLEAMQERQVTLESRSLLLPVPFMTLATQNPIEQEGTYPLPEAQLDRFLLKVLLQYPHEDEEFQLVEQVITGGLGEAFDLSAIRAVMDPKVVLQLQEIASKIDVDRRVTEYAVRLVRATRSWPGVTLGAGPRGSISLLRAARAYALLQGCDYVTPDDIKFLAPPTLRHRLQLAPDMEIEGKTSDHVIQEILSSVEAPRL